MSLHCLSRLAIERDSLVMLLTDYFKVYNLFRFSIFSCSVEIPTFVAQISTMMQATVIDTKMCQLWITVDDSLDSFFRRIHRETEVKIFQLMAALFTGISSGHVKVSTYNNETGVDSWTQMGADTDGEAAHDQSRRCVNLSIDGMIVAIETTRTDGNGTNSGQGKLGLIVLLPFHRHLKKITNNCVNTWKTRRWN